MRYSGMGLPSHHSVRDTNPSEAARLRGTRRLFPLWRDPQMSSPRFAFGCERAPICPKGNGARCIGGSSKLQKQLLGSSEGPVKDASSRKRGKVERAEFGGRLL